MAPLNFVIVKHALLMDSVAFLLATKLLLTADSRADAAGPVGRLHCGKAAVCLLAAGLVPAWHPCSCTVPRNHSVSLAAAFVAVCHRILCSTRGMVVSFAQPECLTMICHSCTAELQLQAPCQSWQQRYVTGYCCKAVTYVAANLS